MTHPRYDAKDKKAGQPVLVGDEIYDDIGNKRIALAIGDSYVTTKWANDGTWAERCHAPFFSAPPAPEIESCVCGSNTPVWRERDCQVACVSCGRRGRCCHHVDDPLATAFEHWNADMVKLKAK
jgi:hypothetical protein